MDSAKKNEFIDITPIANHAPGFAGSNDPRLRGFRTKKTEQSPMTRVPAAAASFLAIMPLEK
jgi:hypothetical protein